MTGRFMRPADVLQHLFAEHVGIAFASLGQGNDFVGDGLLDIIGAIARPQSQPGHFEGDAHDPRRLLVEVLAVEEQPDRLVARSVSQAGAQPVSQPPAPDSGVLPLLRHRARSGGKN